MKDSVKSNRTWLLHIVLIANIIWMVSFDYLSTVLKSGWRLATQVYKYLKKNQKPFPSFDNDVLNIFDQTCLDVSDVQLVTQTPKNIFIPTVKLFLMFQTSQTEVFDFPKHVFEFAPKTSTGKVFTLISRVKFFSQIFPTFQNVDKSGILFRELKECEDSEP